MADIEQPARESFQPIAVRPASEAPLRFALRCALDLQLLTIHRFLRARLGSLRGRVLDVGAGEAPWRDLLTQVDYVGIDVEVAGDFGMRRNPSIVYYDGRTIPFPSRSFDHVLCVEVLEHVEEPVAFVRELARVLRAGGSLVLTVPWSARLHHVPHDYHRFTRFRLQSILAAEGFGEIHIEERGNEVAAVANKMLVMMISLLRPIRSVGVLWRLPLAALMSPVVIVFVAAAHVALAIQRESNDPLGYGVAATRERADPGATF